MTDADLEDLFADEVEVEPSIADNPRALQVVVSLVITGLLVGILVSVILAGLAQVAR